MDTKIPDEVKKVLIKFQDSDFQIYVVGGAVRDLIMGRAVNDWDFTTDATPEQILKIIPEGYYDNNFGTVGLSTDIGIFEITTMRKEGKYQDFRHPIEVGWTNNIEEDLARREITINALALDFKSNKLSIVDPYQGQEDITNKIIRAVGNPSARFREDALRLMRAIRVCAQLDFRIEEKTFSAIKDNAGLISAISMERVRDELLKILESPNPYMGIIKLREAGILQIILPELEKCFGIVQEGPKHDRTYDVGEHSLLTLKETPSKDPIIRLAALLHDVGKAETVSVEPTGNVTFYNHDVVGAHIILKIADRFKLSKIQKEKLFRLVRWHLFSVNENQTDAAIRRFIKNIGVDNVDDIMALRVGDRLGGGTQKAVSWRMETYLKRIDEVLEKPFTISDLKVNGHDVMEILDIPPGRKVGEILDQLFQEVSEDAAKNSREYLLEKVKEIK